MLYILNMILRITKKYYRANETYSNRNTKHYATFNDRHKIKIILFAIHTILGF